MSTSTKILLLLCVTMVAAQEQTTEAAVPPSEGLTQTDYIIIGVTAGVGAIVVFGGIVFACLNSRKSKREKDAVYHDYLNRKVDFQTQGQDNLAYTSSTQQLAVSPDIGGYKAPVNPQQYYMNQPIPYPPGVRSSYDQAPGASTYVPPHEQIPADVYALPPKPTPVQPYAQPYAQPAPVQPPAPVKPVIQQAPIHYAPSQETPSQQAPIQQAPIQQEPEQKAPIQQATQQALINQAPVQQAQTQQAPSYSPTSPPYSITPPTVRAPEPQPVAPASETNFSINYDDEYRSPDAGLERPSEDSESVGEGMTAF